MRNSCLAMMAPLLMAGVVPVLAAAKAPPASATLSAKEALALVGGPLGEISRAESQPNSENGYDHNTSCGYFPKNYRLDEADRPPERGLQVSLHTFRTNGEAKKFFELTRDAEKELTGTNPGGKFSTLKGVGTAGVLSIKRYTLEPKAVYEVALATFWKGSTMAQVTVWKRGVPAGALVTTAARKVAAKLP